MDLINYVFFGGFYLFSLTVQYCTSCLKSKQIDIYNFFKQVHTLVSSNLNFNLTENFRFLFPSFYVPTSSYSYCCINNKVTIY